MRRQVIPIAIAADVAAAVFFNPIPASALDQHSSFISGYNGFDTSSTLTTTQLAQEGEFQYWAFYLGGSNYRGFAPDSNFLETAFLDGYDLIPYWVGAQSPCATQSGLGHYSTDPGTAYNQGKNEADAAFLTSVNRGLGNKTNIIVYDHEPFNSSCAGVPDARGLAKYFLSGWTSEIAHDADYSSIYGAVLGSFAVDWASLSPVPDNAFLAGGQNVDSPFDPGNFSNGSFAFDQRHRQWDYNFSSEAVGVVDRDCANGLVLAQFQQGDLEPQGSSEGSGDAAEDPYCPH